MPIHGKVRVKHAADRTPPPVRPKTLVRGRPKDEPTADVVMKDRSLIVQRASRYLMDMISDE